MRNENRIKLPYPLSSKAKRRVLIHDLIALLALINFAVATYLYFGGN